MFYFILISFLFNWILINYSLFIHIYFKLFNRFIIMLFYIFAISNIKLALYRIDFYIKII